MASLSDVIDKDLLDEATDCAMSIYGEYDAQRIQVCMIQILLQRIKRLEYKLENKINEL
jgi:hypothetical protein